MAGAFEPHVLQHITLFRGGGSPEEDRRRRGWAKGAAMQCDHILSIWMSELTEEGEQGRRVCF